MRRTVPPAIVWPLYSSPAHTYKPSNPLTMSHLIDVRTPEEYATGFLGNAINIPYQDIASLVARPDTKKSDDITLYCRSGRRSGIALGVLKELGFVNVRDIGGLEEAREVLRMEAEAKQIEEREKGGREKRADREGMREASRRLMEGLRDLGE
ncbi:hypothetical protein EJ05DRAFT_501252 [Pseudovirgaria hyperparasitica]|uniref:Rhodanese domain-containing protein n=1 Tax=Pseudovirgaria hyperparasitica TaxID=470096 RepID=A0A6A6W6Y9_9PEZI|nr:uncharacterized protein EJ05DRAFT_501252 [Pseudovirgaria hyperparasitica]KAF2757730.1 hypothetical protein EJ05DRAFT_501252 [Pseudovirgaria hyperparasitica]